jgi:hypothetical protein
MGMRASPCHLYGVVVAGVIDMHTVWYVSLQGIFPPLFFIRRLSSFIDLPLVEKGALVPVRKGH